MEIIGYKYTTEQDAIKAKKDCNAYYGIPISPNEVTQTWVDYEVAELNNPIFWYIRHNDSLNVVLGEPETFEVEIELPTLI